MCARGKRKGRIQGWKLCLGGEDIGRHNLQLILGGEMSPVGGTQFGQG